MFQDILQRVYWHNRILDYLVALSILIGGSLVIRIIGRTILRRLATWARKPSTPIDESLIIIVEKTVFPIFYLGVFYLSIRSLALGPRLTEVVDVLGVILLTIFGIRFLAALVRYSLETYWLKREEATAKQRTVKAIMPIVQVVIWGIGITFLLDNLGVEISTVIAGLGIGGLAVALAAQAILGDLFSYFSIVLDHPFEIGDFIIVGDFLGVVEHIGIKTTRIRSLGGEQLVFSNTDLTSSRVRNYKRMERRRVLFKIGVTYQTSFEHLKQIPTIIRDVIDGVDDTIFDRAHFSSYGDFSLIFETVYYVLSSDYNKYMDIQQQINLGINEEFEERGIEFAYPTQTLYVSRT